MARERKKPGKKEGKGSKPGRDETAAEEETAAESQVTVQARELLARASKLVAERSAWTRREYARDRHSHPVSPSSERAVRFCVGGALLRATSEQFGVQFKLGKEIEPFPDESWADALALAYRYLGHALTRFHLSKNLQSFQEELIDGDWRVRLTLRSVTDQPRKQAKTVEASWPVLVHVINDNPAVKHWNILMALAVAQMTTFGEEGQEASIWLPEEGA